MHNNAVIQGWSTSLFSLTPPQNASVYCIRALTEFFEDTALLAQATEASSHPSGLVSLFSQPYVYAGGGLGNMDECTSAQHAGSTFPLQNCLAGAGTQRDGITFASVCMVPECSATDLSALDFNQHLSTAAASRRQDDPSVASLAVEYVTLFDRITEINRFLHTGWTCGEFKVPWTWWPFTAPYLFLLLNSIIFSIIGTLRCRRRRLRNSSAKEQHGQTSTAGGHCYVRNVSQSDNEMDSDIDTEIFSIENKNHENSPLLSDKQLSINVASIPKQHFRLAYEGTSLHQLNIPDRIWSCFDVHKHVQLLVAPSSSETACLDGIRVGSIFWIMLGHVMAIVSSSGAGYSNPAQFLPPHGLTTTLPGQLLFSSRFAVDTFLCISGYLVVHVLNQKLPLQRSSIVGGYSNLRFHHQHFLWRYITILPLLIAKRLIRILPLYALTLGFYIQIAPHLGSGPFWYQWLALLKPCQEYGWTKNLLFINNFLPLDLPVTETCFYHSWYLAVDMQLFVVAPLLVFWYQSNQKQGRAATLFLLLSSVLITVYLTIRRQWSINTFDGAAVVLFDVEAYAKPHVRAQAYLAGMFVAMLRPANCLSDPRRPWTFHHKAVLIGNLLSMLIVTFITAAGAYARRPCQYSEWPQRDHCGSVWPLSLATLYTASSRTVWTANVAMIMHLCVGRRHLVSSILSWPCWTPLSRLTFGVYLVHPMVIFIWQLGDGEKQVFRKLTFGMDYISVCVVSFLWAWLAAVLVEFPCAALWKLVSSLSQSDMAVVAKTGECRRHSDR